jgi:cell division protease FtsH
VAYDDDAPAFLTAVPGMSTAPRWYNEATAAKMHAAVQRIVEAALRRAQEILEANRALLEQTATKLMEKETLGPAELEPLARRLALGRVA